jgi:hypothetical protein
VADGFHLWATNYDREISDLLALRSEIAQQVVTAMRVQLLPGEKEQLAKKGQRILRRTGYICWAFPSGTGAPEPA